jgi:general secretion pathway protein H
VIAAARTENARNGFTLIEMLVVLLIMGLLVGLVSAVAQPDERAILRGEVERLAALIDVAVTESRASGQSIAWTSNGGGYRFWRFSESAGWAEIVDDDLLRARTLPVGMTILNLRMDGLRPAEKLRVEFNAWGAALSFSVDMTMGAAQCTLDSSPLGEVSVALDCGKANEKSAQL